ncbi:MAG: arsenate reductase ArsC [Firmicutes bacterium HGW-Firmicutes-2]|nr:MAG: arsenate reductase ArsC [Firmicutes bacterium HGW-Firmicutes-2]
MKTKVLFVCVHNSARSQMAEAFLKKLGGDHFEVESAGFAPTKINPLVVEVMKEEGIDLSEKKTQSVFSLVKAQKFYGYVITVCNRAKETECPIFPGSPIRLHWDLENPEDYTGTHEEKLNKVRELKNQIKELIVDFIK